MIGKGHNGAFWGDENIFYINLGGSYTQTDMHLVKTHIKIYQDIQLKFVHLLRRNFILRKSVNKLYSPFNRRRLFSTHTLSRHHASWLFIQPGRWGASSGPYTGPSVLTHSLRLYIPVI